MARRSVLFSPGDQPALLRKAPETGADVVVFDLEDGVSPTKKVEARDAVRTVCKAITPGCECCVRINPLDSGGRADIDSLTDVAESIDSVMLPKVTDTRQIEHCRETLTAAGLSQPILALLETPGGVLDASAIAAEESVDCLLLGAEDLAAAIGATRTDRGEEVSYARQRVVLAAASAGVDAIDTLVTTFEDTEQLRRDSRQALKFGFDGKMAIHPDQVTVINEAFTPTPDRIEWAERVLAAAAESSQGVVALDGEMIDAPLISQAAQIVERGRAAGMTNE